MPDSAQADGGYGRSVFAGLSSAGAREVLVCGRRRLSGRAVLELVAGGAQALAARGVGPGATIACLYGGQPESAVARLVALSLGGAYIHGCPELPAEAMTRAMRALNASVLLYEPSREAEADALLAEYPVPIACRLDQGPGGLFASGGGRLEIHDPPDPGTVNLVTFSSGTTGERKAVAYSHRAQKAQLEAARALYGPGPWRFLVVPGPRVLQDMYAWWTLAGGGTVHLQHDGRPEELAAAVRRERVTHLLAGRPVGLYALTEHPRATGDPLESLRVAVYGGAAGVPARTMRALDRLGPVLMQTYGTSEGGFLTVLTQADHERPELLSSAGRAVPGVELRVRGPDLADLPAGEVGEVWARTPQRMLGYCGDPGRTAAALRDGWVRTGDLGRLDDQGYLFLVDRLEDRLPGGIYSHPIEHALAGHPAVVEAAVFTVPHAGGPLLAGVVVRRDGHHVDPRDLRLLVRRTLGRRCEPQRLWFVDRIPRTPAGKPDKAALRAGYQDGDPRSLRYAR
ncbi:class I adenylate-forming enzyme family protein [Actinomadura macrotermitis]|uniref:8-demethylnovobiocic acid synthase n=1 Tax=Actinomadura macrotermitis TaxID=2585200 RepID=A0A7K0C3Z4_9ACTN|nr:AMP-binding protein [Actinomadura macrotermitis]MQY08161.1 8-demethylnovobiocic acid synthase [Actinomadura macrotermitis]